MIAKESPTTEQESGHQAGASGMDSKHRQNLDPDPFSGKFTSSRYLRG